MSSSFASSKQPSVERPPEVKAVLELELPDGSDFNPPPRRTEPATALRFVEEMAPFFHDTECDRATRRDRPAMEFDLENPDPAPARYPAEFLDELLRRD